MAVYEDVVLDGERDAAQERRDGSVVALRIDARLGRLDSRIIRIEQFDERVQFPIAFLGRCRAGVPQLAHRAVAGAQHARRVSQGKLVQSFHVSHISRSR